MKSLPALSLIGAGFFGTLIYGEQMNKAAAINAKGIAPIKTEGYSIPNESFANARITQVDLEYDPAHPERVMVLDPKDSTRVVRLRAPKGCVATTPEGSVTILRPDIALLGCGSYREGIRKGYADR